jgi:hypothetical protein
MKHIVVAGCSFTHNFRVNIPNEDGWLMHPIENWTWANWLQDYLKDTHKVYNYGSITNDNKTIARSLIYKINDLLDNGVKSEDIIVIAQWTSITRTSFFVSPEKYHISNPFVNYIKKNENLPHTADFILKDKDKTSPYEQGYIHLSGGYCPPTGNKINVDSTIESFFENVLTHSERYYEWFEYMTFLLTFLETKGINKIKFFSMNNNFSKKYLENGTLPPFFNRTKNSVFDSIIVHKDICNTWEQDKIIFDNSYVKSYSNKINFEKYFWFYNEENLHRFGGLIEWTIRKFNYDLESGDLPKVLWREMNGMDIEQQKNYLELSWYGHTSSFMAKKFVNEVVLQWDIF